MLQSQIKRMIEQLELIKPPGGNVEAASYDIRLGKEYHKGGETSRLSNDNPCLEVPPNDVVIASSYEVLKLPPFSIGHYFGLHRRYQRMGLPLFSGGHVDPGFEGRLFFPIFNFSNESRRMRFGEHLCSIEFQYTTPPTSEDEPYAGEHQRVTSLEQWLPGGMELKSGLPDFREEVRGQLERFKDKYDEDIREALQRERRTIWGFIALLGIAFGLLAFLEVLVAVVTLLLALRG